MKHSHRAAVKQVQLLNFHTSYCSQATAVLHRGVTANCRWVQNHERVIFQHSVGGSTLTDTRLARATVFWHRCCRAAINLISKHRFEMHFFLHNMKTDVIWRASPTHNVPLKNIRRAKAYQKQIVRTEAAWANLLILKCGLKLRTGFDDKRLLWCFATASKSQHFASRQRFSDYKKLVKSSISYAIRRTAGCSSKCNNPCLAVRGTCCNR